MPPLAPLPKSLPPQPPRRRFNRQAVYLSVAIAAVTLPFTLRYQHNRYAHAPTPAPLPALNKFQGRLPGLDGITESEARARFGAPVQSREFELNVGSFAGPDIGLKHYYRLNEPDYDKHMKADTKWMFPEYSSIREVIWRLPDSYLTIWLQEPRAEINLGQDDAEITLPTTAGGEWVALDNYCVGKDLLKVQPTFH